MKKKLVIFDLDGTLINSLEDLALSVNTLLEHYQLPQHPIENYKYFVGNGVTNLIERALPKQFCEKEFIEMFREEFKKHYFAHQFDHTKPYIGIIELLETLVQSNIKVAIASNKPHEATLMISKRLFPTIPFVSVLGQREGIPTKPDPTIILDILNQEKNNRSEVLYVGDSGVDIETAQRAQVESIGVLWGYRTKEELLANGCTNFIKTPSELIKHT